MRHLILIITIALVMLSCSSNEIVKQEPINNDSLTISTLKEWRDSHFGMFIHFGVYSELGGIWKGEKIFKDTVNQLLSYTTWRDSAF